MAVADDAERLRKLAEREGLVGGDFLKACAHIVAEAVEAAKGIASPKATPTPQGQAVHPMNTPAYPEEFEKHVARHAEAEKTSMTKHNAIDKLFKGK